MAGDLERRIVKRIVKRSSVLVVGNQDAGKLQGYKLSSKRKKAEELIKVGHPIQIVTEADVFVLVGDPPRNESSFPPVSLCRCELERVAPVPIRQGRRMTLAAAVRFAFRSSNAAARPSPLLAPVTQATRPATENRGLSSTAPTESAVDAQLEVLVGEVLAQPDVRRACVTLHALEA